MKLFVIDGCDGSGKETQARLITERLQKEGYNARFISFPNYNSPYSSLVKGYLDGDFGKTAYSVSPKAASVLFAVDRFASMKTDDWMDCDIVIADRYTTSNMVCQTAKLTNEKDKLEFIEWLKSFEYGILSLPEPDSVIFLDVPPEISLRLRKERADLKNGCHNDIHESDKEFMEKSYDSAAFCSSVLNWHRIRCADCHQKLMSVESINDEIYSYILKKIEGGDTK